MWHCNLPHCGWALSRLLALLGAAIGWTALNAGAAIAEQSAQSPLQLESKIPLGAVKGRIDHMAVDVPRQRRRGDAV